MLRRLAAFCYTPPLARADRVGRAARRCERARADRRRRSAEDVLAAGHRVADARSTCSKQQLRAQGRHRQPRVQGARRRHVTSPAVQAADRAGDRRSSRKQPHVVSVTHSVRPGGRAVHLAGRQDRVRRDPVRRAVERRAGRSRDAHAQHRRARRTRRHVAGRARRLHVHRPDAAGERADRHPRRGRHPAARVRFAARDGPADHDRAVRHRDRPRDRHAARPRAWTSRRSRRRSRR